MKLHLDSLAKICIINRVKGNLTSEFSKDSIAADGRVLMAADLRRLQFSGIHPTIIIITLLHRASTGAVAG